MSQYRPNNRRRNELAKFLLPDYADASKPPIEIEIKLVNGYLCIYPKGYGECGAENGDGAPVLLDHYEGRLRVVIAAEINSEDQQIIDLEGARESNRK